eukprot:6212840-Pleurochrysis_carterae.AAC.2
MSIREVGCSRDIQRKRCLHVPPGLSVTVRAQDRAFLCARSLAAPAAPPPPRCAFRSPRRRSA